MDTLRSELAAGWVQSDGFFRGSGHTSSPISEQRTPGRDRDGPHETGDLSVPPPRAQGTSQTGKLWAS